MGLMIFYGNNEIEMNGYDQACSTIRGMLVEMREKLDDDEARKLLDHVLNQIKIMTTKQVVVKEAFDPFMGSEC